MAEKSTPLAQRLVEAAADAILMSDGRSTPDPETFFGRGIYGVNGAAAVIAVLRELADTMLDNIPAQVWGPVELRALADSIEMGGEYTEGGNGD